MLPNREGSVCRNMFPFRSCMMHIFHVPLQTHFCSPLTPASLWCPVRLVSVYKHSDPLCQDEFICPQIDTTALLPLWLMQLQRELSIIWKIMELGLSCHFQPRVPLLGGFFRWLTGVISQNTDSGFTVFTLHPEASSLLLRGEHCQTTQCPCMPQSRSEELTLFRVHIGLSSWC